MSMPVVSDVWTFEKIINKVATEYLSDRVGGHATCYSRRERKLVYGVEVANGPVTLPQSRRQSDARADVVACCLNGVDHLHVASEVRGYSGCDYHESAPYLSSVAFWRPSHARQQPVP